MNRQEFLDALAARLRALPQSEVQKSLSYYAEMIDDRIETGMDEQQAVAALGDVQEIADTVLQAIPIAALVRARIQPARRWSVAQAVLLILGSPVWAPLVLTAAILALVAYLLLWVLAACCWAIVVSFAAGAVAGLSAAGFLVRRNPITAALMLGCGLICAGLTILSFFGMKELSRYLLHLTVRFVLWIKRGLLQKEAA